MGWELEAFDACADALRTGRAIPINAEYRRYAQLPRITAANSPNHGCTGACPDCVNLLNGRETVLDRDEQRAKAEAWAEATLCGNEAFARSFYTRMNLNGYRILREVWRALGEPELADRLHRKLRSVIAHLALPSVPVEPLWFSDAELEKDGPGLFVAERAPRRTFHGVATPACGARSASDKAAGTTGKPPKPGTPSPIKNWNPPENAIIVGEVVRRKLDAVGAALEARGLMGHWLTSEESLVVLAAINGEPEARRELWAWVQEGTPQDTFHLLAFRNSGAMLCTDAHASSTTPVEGGTVNRHTGAGQCVVANPVHREHKGGQDTIRPTEGRILEEGGFLVFYAQRRDKSLPAQRLVLGPVDELELWGENGPAGAVLHKAPWSTPAPPPPPPVPGPPPKPKGKGGGCLVLLGAILAGLAAACAAVAL